MTSAERQPMLFEDLPIPAVAQAVRAAFARRCRAAVPLLRAVQLVLDFDFREFAAQAAGLLDAEDTAYDFPTRRRTLAGREPPPSTSAASSVWAMAAAASRGKASNVKARHSKPPHTAAQPPLIRVDREAGRVRVVRLRPEETEEWAERERLRRARQRPPKPTKAAKSRGKKVRAWDGEAVEE